MGDRAMDQGSTPIHNIGTAERSRATTPTTRAVVPIVGERRRPLAVRLRDYGGSFLFVVPYFLFFIAFLLWPLVYALWVSLRNWTTTGGATGFTGLLHYYNLLFNWKLDDTIYFWQSLLNT